MLTSEAIRAARERLGESQAQFAQRFGVAQPTVHRWETDGPPDRGAARLAIEKMLVELAAAEAGAPQ